jgi:hypothetical protein
VGLLSCAQRCCIRCNRHHVVRSPFSRLAATNLAPCSPWRWC